MSSSSLVVYVVLQNNVDSVVCLHRVDLYIPGIETVGGYSITSPPHQLCVDGTINLAIQHSDHPPALWMTTKVYFKYTVKILHVWLVASHPHFYIIID